MARDPEWRERSGPAGGAPRMYAAWRQWTAAHALAGVVAFGGTALLSLLVGFEAFVEAREPVPALGTLFVAGSLLAGPSLAVAEWGLLRERFPPLRKASWILATATGTQVAWVLGSIPTLLLSLGSEGPTRLLQPDVWVIYLLAVGLGAVLGVLVSLPQWAVLRPLVPHTGIWIAGTVAGWGAALFLLVVGLGLLSPDGSGGAGPVVLLAVSAAAGAGLGAVQGAVVLPWLAPGSPDASRG